MRKYIVGIVVAALMSAMALFIAPSAEAAPSTPRNFALVCITGPFKPRMDISGFDVNGPNTKMDASKILYRSLSKATGRQSNFKVQWARVIWNTKSGTGRNGSSYEWTAIGRNGGPRVQGPTESWNPRAVDTHGTRVIKRVRMQVQVDRNHVCNSPWVQAN